MKSAKELAGAKELARDLVQVQGNLFIRELLRQHGYPPKRNLKELLNVLNQAIDDGKVTREILNEWLTRVEGWGRQSVYLWRVPKNLARIPWWKPDEMKARVEGAGIKKWDADTSGVFKDKFTLTSVRLRNTVLTFEWHKAWENLLRAEEYDDEKEIPNVDDTIVLKAYRRSKRRATVRVQVNPKEGIAAAFVQIPTSSADHKTVLDAAIEKVQSVVPKEKFRLFDMPAVINNLDERQLSPDEEKLWAKSTRLDVGGGYIELASTTKDSGYRDFDQLIGARDTLVGQKLDGEKAAFYFQAPGGIDTIRAVRVDFFGSESRFWLRAAMTEGQVWEFIKLLVKAS